MIDQKHFNVLEFIYRNPYISFAELCVCLNRTTDTEGIVNELERQRLIDFRVYGSADLDTGECHLYVEPDSHLLATISGNVIVENRRYTDKRWRITTAIALFATVGAYREELASLLQAIAKLLR